MSSQEDRDSYTWDNCIKDLALLTPLTLSDSIAVVRSVSTMSDVHPYDALEPLKLLFGGSDFKTKAYGLEQLLKHHEADHG